MCKAMLAGLMIVLSYCFASLAAAPEETRCASVGQVRGDSVRELIVGKWSEAMNPAANATIEFSRNGKLKISAAGVIFDGTYKFLNDKQIEVKIDLNGAGQTAKLNIKITKDEMITTQDGHQRAERFKRSK
jgi:uncharacterized protein (TIGR03066 family)